MMYKYFLAACVAVLCATDYSFAMQQESVGYQEEEIDQVVRTQLARMAAYLPKDETDKFLVRSNAINIMTSFAKKYGTFVLQKQVDKFIRNMQNQPVWGAEWMVYSHKDTPVLKFCDSLTNYQEEGIDQVVRTQLARMAAYLPKDETDKFLVRSNAINIMTSFAKKYGTFVLQKQVDKFIRNMQNQPVWGAEWQTYSYDDTPVISFCQKLRETGESDEDFANKQIDEILAYYDGELEKTDMDKLPELRQTAIDFVSKKGQEALTEEINEYRRNCAKSHGAIISQLIVYLQGEVNN